MGLQARGPPRPREVLAAGAEEVLEADGAQGEGSGWGARQSAGTHAEGGEQPLEHSEHRQAAKTIGTADTLLPGH